MNFKKLFSFFKKSEEDSAVEVKVKKGSGSERENNNKEEGKESGKGRSLTDSLKAFKSSKGALVFVGVFLVLGAFGFTFYKTHYKAYQSNGYLAGKGKTAVNREKRTDTKSKFLQRRKPKESSKTNLALNQEQRDKELKKQMQEQVQKQLQSQGQSQEQGRNQQRQKEQERQRREQRRLEKAKLKRQKEKIEDLRFNPKAFQEFYLTLLKEAIERKKKELLTLEEEVERLKEEREKLSTPIVIKRLPKKRRKEKKEEVLLFPVKVKAIICHDKCVALTNFGPLREGSVLGSERVVKITDSCVITTKRKLCM